MSGDTLYERPQRKNVPEIRAHDYLYDSTFIVSGARDYARTAFKGAMASAQVIIQPVYRTMFSNIKKYPRMRVVYYPNCRLPDHVDASYGAYVRRRRIAPAASTPELLGKERFKYCAAPRQVLAVPSTTPDFQPQTPECAPSLPHKPRSRGTQSLYRESSAQTVPWQPDARPAESCERTPEVLYLDKLEWGPGQPYRTGDLPADFHTTEIINKMRHARIWSEVAEQGKFPRWMKKRDAIITDVETKDWIFRETEIDELQEIRLELLHRMQMANRQKQTSRTGTKLARLWDAKKREMDKKIEGIRRTRDRELRKLSAVHSSGGRAGLVAALRASRGAGSARAEAVDPSSDAHAPLARHGYQARRRHAEITYDPDLLSLEDHEELSKPPSWLDKCGQDLTRTCSGHHLPRDATQLCQRETKWSESFLESLHNDLKKARLGAGSQSAGPLRVLRPRVTNASPRPPTPEVEAVDDTEEENHQAALMLQRVLRGRAVQTLMYEGRTRAAELTEELKTTHGLQKEDKSRIAREETKAREYNIFKMEREQREEAVTALVDELCGGAVSTALDFLEKELRRLREERRQHAYILIALRDKTMREAAEAGRRQKEEHRRMEHDQMFKQILGVTQETVDDYLLEIVSGGVELAAERDALRRAQANADKIDADFAENESISTAEQNELVAELVHQFLLPHAHRTAARHRIAATQQARMEAARSTIFGLIDEPNKTELQCIKCGTPLDERCRCKICPISLAPAERPARDDPRWKHTRSRPRVEPKSLSERYPVHHELRCMLNVLVDEAVLESRDTRRARVALRSEWGRSLRERTEATIDAVEMIDTAISRATGEVPVPLKKREYHHYMKRVIGDALERSEPYHKSPCPLELPSEVRRRAEEEARLGDSTCRCEDDGKSAIQLDHEKHLLPSELRALEDLRRCKCDADSITTATHDQCSTEDFETNVEGEDDETDLI